jgi:ribonuclease III
LTVPKLDPLQKRLGYKFKNTRLLQLALTHPSVAHEASEGIPHNQRLEFLGDSVLGLVLTSELYARFPDVSEGPLTKARAQMVNRRTLAAQAKRIGLGENLILSRGEETTGGRDRPSNLADAYEALLGAIFVDGGYEQAREVILSSFRDAFGELKAIPNLDNPKGELQEMLQAQSPDPPEYQMTSVTGPDHDRMFECAVYHDGVELGRGKGKSKKAAESEAATAALAHLRERRSASKKS